MRNVNVHRPMFNMRSLLTLVLFLVLSSAQFSSSAFGANAPIFGTPANTNLNFGSEIRYLFIPNVDDGDPADQTLAFTVTSSDETVLKLEGNVIFNPGDRVAIVPVKTLKTGSANLTVKAKDSDNLEYQLSFNVVVGVYSFPGINFEYYDVQFWQELADDAVAIPGTYQVIQDAKSPIENLAKDFFWQRMWGWITVAETGEYFFKTEAPGDNKAYLSLSSDASPKNKTEIATHGNPSVGINLIAGKPYYWMAKSADIVNSQPFNVYMATPSTGYQILTGVYSSPVCDTIAPSTPQNLQVITTGVNDLLVKWDAVPDRPILGYYIYVNGTKLNQVITTNQYLITGLNPSTKYSIVVVAADKYENYSAPSVTINATTYAVDAVAPTKPTGLKLDKAYDLGLAISWTASTDGQSEIRGYNVYVGGVKVNTDYIKSTNFLITKLNKSTSYNIQVEAFDAAYNASGKSNVSMMSTTDFNPAEALPGQKKGRVQVLDEAITTSNGFAVLAGYNPGSVLMANCVRFPNFEHPGFASAGNLGNLDKEVSSNIVYSPITGADVFAGARSAKLKVGNGESFSAKFNSYVDNALPWQYEIRIALKKDATYTGNVKVQVVGTWGDIAYDNTISITDTWNVYSMKFTPTYTGVEKGWKIKLTFNANGSVFVDDIMFGRANDVLVVDGEDTPYSKFGYDLMNEFKPSGIRWGALGANQDKFAEHVGYRQNDFTYADWMNYCNLVGAKTIITGGVYEKYDWYAVPATFKNFMDYMGGSDATNVWTKKRIEEEGYADLMSKSKGLIFEFGNEVWGGGCLLPADGGPADGCGTNHSSVQWKSKPAAYGAWCRSMVSTQFTQSPAFTQYRDKIFTCYSGGTTDMTSFGNWSPLAYKGDADIVDWLAVMGYMGGNLSYTPEIPRGESELAYHKNTVELLNNYWGGLKNLQKDMLKNNGRILPMYMYEGNMTRDDLNARLGQAINFTDYYAGCIENGVAAPVVFALEGGQWRILDDKTYKKLPLFHTSALFNKHCVGAVLKTEFISADTLVNTSGNGKINIAPVSTHAYANGTDYSVLLISRDFENEYSVEVKLPASWSVENKYKVYSITGAEFQTYDAVVDSTSEVLTTPNGLVVKVPAYSMIVVKFKAGNFTKPVPAEGVFNYKKVTNINITTDLGTNTITTDGGKLRLIATVEPADAFAKDLAWDVVENTSDASFSMSTFNVTDRKLNGEITLRAKATDGSGIYTDYKVIIDVAGQSTLSVEENMLDQISVYPNPADNKLFVNIPAQVSANVALKLFASSGALALTQVAESGTTAELNIENLNNGVYFLQIVTDKNTVTKRVIVK